MSHTVFIKGISTLAFEAETAINQLPPSEQDPIRYQVATNIQKLYSQFEKKKTSQQDS